MRPTDKFCAECGAPAAPRSKRSRNLTADSTDAEPAAERSTTPEAPAPARQWVPRSTAEVVRAPLPNKPRSAGNVRPPEITPPAPPLTSAAPARAYEAPSAAKSGTAPERFRWPETDEQEQALFEQEEIASVRDLTPVEVVPDFPPTKPRHSPGAQTCPACGRPNPPESHFCDGCGSALQGAQPAAVAPQAASGWQYDAQAAPRPAAPEAKPSAPAASPTQPSAQQSDNAFFYYYDDKKAAGGNRRLLIILLVVLAVGIAGLIYLMTHSASKPAAVGNVTISISPADAQTTVNGKLDFSATVSGSGETDVNWSVDEGSAGGKMVNRGAQADGGVVATKALYLAPPTPGTYHVVATSKADPTKSATAEVLVSGVPAK